MIEWRFKRKSPDDMNIDPIQGEFFSTQEVDISTSLIREGIQNALDERDRNSDQMVKVRIFISGDSSSVSPEKYLKIIDSLIPHLTARDSGIAPSSLPSFNGPMRFLVFEDFNTKGLAGDPEEHHVNNPNDGQDHNFYYFWRNVGRSGKSGIDSLGKWGLGKTVFPACSKINTFWGLTVRRTDARKMLMGQSILRIHDDPYEDDDSKVCIPYGMYSSYTGADYFARPIEEPDLLNFFEETFKLERKSESGLSVIIPFCIEELTADHLAYATIEQYFYPVLQGRLEVAICAEDKTILLNRNTIEDALDEINFSLLENFDGPQPRNAENLRKLFNLARWSFGLSENDYYRLNPLENDLKPRWNASMFADEEKLNVTRERFENGERIAIKIPLKFEPYDKPHSLQWYNLFLEKDPSLSKPDNLFVRDGITITGIKSLEKGLVRGLVVIQDEKLNQLLGDSENPAHTDWLADSRNFKGRYINGYETLQFVKGTIKKVYDKLQKPIEGIQKDLLSDFFSIPNEQDEPKPRLNRPENKKRGTDEKPDSELPKITGKQRPVLLSRIPSGFKVYANPDAEEFPETVRISLGYDVPKGNPIKNYQEPDFDVSRAPVKSESKNVYFQKREKNIIEFDIEKPGDFEVSFSGFDEKRDLYIKIQSK